MCGCGCQLALIAAAETAAASAGTQTSESVPTGRPPSERVMIMASLLQWLKRIAINPLSHNLSVRVRR